MGDYTGAQGLLTKQNFLLIYRCGKLKAAPAAGEEKPYYADFRVRPDGDHGEDDVLNLIIEVTGQKRKDKEAKVATARDMWAPAINNHGGFGRWAFLEVRDPWNSQMEIRNTAWRCNV